MSDLEHVLRTPLPWRADILTECGLTPAGHTTITRDEFAAKVKREGQKRSAMTTCMTCWGTASRWPTWEQDPVTRLSRETAGWGPGNPQLRDELFAIAALIAAHRDEFDGYLTDLGSTVRLADRRQGPRRAWT